MITKQTENYRRQQASLDSVRRPSAEDRAESQSPAAIAGIAKVVTNDGDGDYTITQQWWDSDAGPPAWGDATSPGGLVSCEARDINQRDDGRVDQIVRFWQGRNISGGLETWIDLGWISTGFWAEITGNASDGTNRWKYAFSEVYKSSSGYGGWAMLSGGRSGTTSTNPARNTIEDMNTGADAHVEGCGVDVDHLDTTDWTFEIMPCTTGNIVWMREVAQGESTEYWFSYENGVDGECD